jgi:hypothetical protein
MCVLRRVMSDVLHAAAAVRMLLQQSYFVAFALACFAALARIQVRLGQLLVDTVAAHNATAELSVPRPPRSTTRSTTSSATSSATSSVPAPPAKLRCCWSSAGLPAVTAVADDSSTNSKVRCDSFGGTLMAYSLLLSVGFRPVWVSHPAAHAARAPLGSAPSLVSRTAKWSCVARMGRKSHAGAAHGTARQASRYARAVERPPLTVSHSPPSRAGSRRCGRQSQG